MKKTAGKAPAFQFYVMDWMTDLDAHPLEIEGAWMRIICKLWREKDRGRGTYSLCQWSRILRTTKEKTIAIIDYIKAHNIGNVVTVERNGVTGRNKIITIENRRMLRDEASRKSNANRQLKYREKQKRQNNTVNTQKVTPPSSSSSSTSSSNNTSVIITEAITQLLKIWNSFARHKAKQSECFALERELSSVFSDMPEVGKDEILVAVENYKKALAVPNSQAHHHTLLQWLRRGHYKNYLPGYFNIDNYDSAKFHKGEKEKSGAELLGLENA